MAVSVNIDGPHWKNGDTCDKLKEQKKGYDTIASK
jgi:hypothetical protein